MNKLLSEIVRGHWMLTNEAAEAYKIMADKILSGETFPEKKLSYNLQFFDNNSKTIAISDDSYSATDLSAIPKGTIAVMPINGVMTKYDNCGYYGTQSMANLVDSLAANENIDAIILRIDSPGGTADGSYDLALSIKNARKIKPVVAYADGYMASAAYRAGMNADTIVAKPGSIIGSIGTMFSTRIYKNENVKEIAVYADSSSEKNLAFENLIKNEDSTLLKETLLNPMNEVFLNEVKSARPTINEAAHKGATYVGKEAKKMNLIDKEGPMQVALNEAQKLIKDRKKTLQSSKNNQMSFIEKFPKVSAFFGLSAETSTEKQTLTDTEILALESVAGDNLQLKKEVETMQLSVAQKEAAITALTAERDEWKTKAEIFGAQPGALAINSVEQTEEQFEHDFSHIKDANIRASFEKDWNQKNKTVVEKN